MAAETAERPSSSGATPVDGPGGRLESQVDARSERRAQRRAARGGASLTGGVGLVVVGVLFLLQNAGLSVPSQQVWGGLCYVLAAGAAATAFARYQAAGRQFTQVVSSATSGALLLAFVGTMLFFNWSWGALWPMLLIIPGAMGIIAAAAQREAPGSTR